MFRALLLCCTFFCTTLYAEEPKIVLKDSFSVHVSEELKTNLPKQFSLAVGSGLTASDTKDTWVGVTDRGPRVDLSCDGAKKCEGDYFGTLDFVPGFSLIQKTSDKYTATTFTPLYRIKKGEKEYARGFPKGCIEESSTFQVDPEGVVLDKDGKLWIVEESEPSLLRVNRTTGEVEKRYLPGDELPKWLRKIAFNIGLEGVTIDSDGRLWMALQATLEEEEYIRVLRFDPKKEKSKTYRYSLDHVSKSDRSFVKISTIEAISDKEFFLIERVPNGLDERYFLLRVKKEEKSLKKVYRKELLFPEKTTAKKLEGLSYNARDETLLIITDSDFGVTEDSPCGEDSTLTTIYKISLASENMK